MLARRRAVRLRQQRVSNLKVGCAGRVGSRRPLVKQPLGAFLEPLRIISLGWGVQSFTIAAMSALGELPPVHAAIHADTTHEREETYAFSRRWSEWLIERGVNVVTVSDQKQAQYVSTEKTDIPAFTVSPFSDGQLRRQCTGRWKINPMRRWVSAELERLGISKRPGVVEQWLGISLDEVERIKPSDVKYITHHWPLIEKRMTRVGCVKWLQSYGLEVPPKSACIFCPYHNAAAWRELKRNKSDWDKAVMVDEAIRKTRPPFDLYIHPSRRPLKDLDFRSQQERGQLELFAEECSGVCFV